MSDNRDIVERLLDFERCGRTSASLINLRECAAIEIAKLRRDLEETDDTVSRYRAALETIAGSSQDKLQAIQAKAALTNIGAAVPQS